MTSEHKETYEETETVITVQGVDFSYEKGKKVLEHLDWQVKKGSIYGLLGGNGAGKTTLMKLICGILKPRRGKIKTNGTVRYLVQNPLSILPRSRRRMNWQSAAAGIPRLWKKCSRRWN